jgi:hypothetical protein
LKHHEASRSYPEQFILNREWWVHRSTQNRPYALLSEVWRKYNEWMENDIHKDGSKFCGASNQFYGKVEQWVIKGLGAGKVTWYAPSPQLFARWKEEDEVQADPMPELEADPIDTLFSETVIEANIKMEEERKAKLRQELRDNKAKERERMNRDASNRKLLSDLIFRMRKWMKHADPSPDRDKAIAFVADYDALQRELGQDGLLVEDLLKETDHWNEVMTPTTPEA